MTVQELINYIETNLKNNCINSEDFMYINIDYMHRAVKLINIEIDKVVLETRFTKHFKSLNIENILQQLEDIQNKDFNIWLRATVMFKPANYFFVRENQANIYYDYNFDLSKTNDE